MNISEIKEVIQEARSEFVMEKVQESLSNNFNIEDTIVECLKKNFNLEKGHSGFDFQNGIRDITFFDKEGNEVEITYRVICKEEIL